MLYSNALQEDIFHVECGHLSDNYWRHFPNRIIKITGGICARGHFIVYVYEIGSEFKCLMASNDGVVLS